MTETRELISDKGEKILVEIPSTLLGNKDGYTTIDSIISVIREAKQWLKKYKDLERSVDVDTRNLYADIAAYPHNLHLYLRLTKDIIKFIRHAVSILQTSNPDTITDDERVILHQSEDIIDIYDNTFIIMCLADRDVRDSLKKLWNRIYRKYGHSPIWIIKYLGHIYEEEVVKSFGMDIIDVVKYLYGLSRAERMKLLGNIIACP